MTTPFVDPQSLHNPATGTSPPASWGDAVRDGLVFCATPPSCRANRTTNLSVASSTTTYVAFDAADSWDTDSFHSTSTNPTRLTVPAGLAGKFLIIASLEWPDHSTGWRDMIVLANGVSTLAASRSAGTPYPISQLTTIEQLAAGDYLELAVWQNSGATLLAPNARLTIVQVSL